VARQDQLIQNISDTALWVAHYRAMESERPDALFRDPYAKLLAGDRGADIVKRLPAAHRNAWAMIVRTFAFDEIIQRLIRQNGVDTVLNLAAGLDTRPYRLDFPSPIKWIEVDLEPILQYKEQKMHGEQPRCRLERVNLDLSDQKARKELFSRVGTSGKQVLVLTEGLMVYLTSEQAASLAADLHAQSTFRWWVLDLVSPRLLKMVQRAWNKELTAAGAPLQFAPKESTDFFRTHGWQESEFHSTWEDGRRLNRRLKNAWIFDILMSAGSKKTREANKRMGATFLLERI
jgi:methyltransferase (TIGR00027 family)